MMVIVVALATREPRHESDIGRGVVEVAVADVVTEPVDRGRQHEDVHERVDGRRQQSPAKAEADAERGSAKAEADQAMVEHMRVPPAGLDVACIALDDVGAADLAHVVEDVADLDLPEAFECRTVRIAFLIRERVVLAVHRHPFLRRQPGGQPQRELEHPLDRRVQRERFMRRTAV